MGMCDGMCDGDAWSAFTVTGLRRLRMRAQLPDATRAVLHRRRRQALVHGVLLLHTPASVFARHPLQDG